MKPLYMQRIQSVDKNVKLAKEWKLIYNIASFSMLYAHFCVITMTLKSFGLLVLRSIMMQGLQKKTPRFYGECEF